MERNDYDYDYTKMSNPEYEAAHNAEEEMPYAKSEPSEIDKRQAMRRKRRIRRRRFFILVVFTLLIAGLLGGVLIFIDKKGYADVETIMVEGNMHYDTVDILETSGAVMGEGLLSVSGKKIISNIQTLPYIKSVKVTKKFPHTLRITVAERHPKYAVYFGGFFVLIDDEMVMLEKRNNSSELAIIEGFVPEKFKLGTVFKPEKSKNFNLSIKLLNALKEKGLNVYKLSYRNGIMRVYFGKNIVCEGSYDNLMKYITELNEILYSLSTQKIERATIYIGDNGYISFSPKIE